MSNQQCAYRCAGSLRGKRKVVKKGDFTSPYVSVWKYQHAATNALKRFLIGQFAKCFLLIGSIKRFGVCNKTALWPQKHRHCWLGVIYLHPCQSSWLQPNVQGCRPMLLPVVYVLRFEQIMPLLSWSISFIDSGLPTAKK